MYSKFPFSMENLPRQSSFICLSLKFGCIFSGLLIILYSVLGLAQCIANIGDLAPVLSPKHFEGMLTYALIISISIIHCVTLFLSTVMLVGTLREKPYLMKPWVIWMSLLVMGHLMLFVFWTTMSMINRVADNSLVAYVMEFLTLLIRSYMLILVASYHKQLEEDQYGAEPLKLKSNSNDTWYSAA